MLGSPWPNVGMTMSASSKASDQAVDVEVSAAVGHSLRSRIGLFELLKIRLN
jgi:hypothetical protein